MVASGRVDQSATSLQGSLFSAVVAPGCVDQPATARNSHHSAHTTYDSPAPTVCFMGWYSEPFDFPLWTIPPKLPELFGNFLMGLCTLLDCIGK